MKLYTRDVQRLLTAAGYYNGGIDNDYGPKTKTAVGKVIDNNASKVPGRMSETRRLVAAAQLILDAAGYEPGEIDGYAGHNTVEAFNAWDYRQQHGKEEVLDRDAPSTGPEPAGRGWPHQSGVTQFYGAVGTDQTRIEIPYAMRIAWNLRQSVSSFLCHEKVAEPMRLILVRTLDHFGYERVKAMGLDLFGGCLNVRKMRGGSSYSMHSWGIAVDLDPANNQLRWKRDRARFAQPEYAPFWRIVEDAGAVSLGRARDFDWMHFQFARL